MTRYAVALHKPLPEGSFLLSGTDPPVATPVSKEQAEEYVKGLVRRYRNLRQDPELIEDFWF